KLMAEIRDGLADFELPYEEGNWEKFQQLYAETSIKTVRKRRTLPLTRWKYGAAAAVLIGALVYLPWHRTDRQPVVPERTAEHRNKPVAHEGPAAPAGKGGDTLPIPPTHSLATVQPTKAARPMAHPLLAETPVDDGAAQKKAQPAPRPA